MPLKRRPARFGRVIAVAAVLALLPVLPHRASAVPERSFDFDNGNIAVEVIIPVVEPLILQTLKPSDASLILRLTALHTNAWFDAIAPYHPTAVGVYSRLGRRPASEGVTNRHRNIAMMYASYRILLSLFPQYEQEWRDMVASVGLDPDNNSRNRTTPVGIGNRAGNAVVAARLHDGMNQLGDEGGRRYNRQPYADYLGYEPVNTAYELRDPSRWQPNVEDNGDGIFRAQVFVTPQYAVTEPYSYDSPKDFDVPPPVDSDPVENPAGYREQADEVLAVSAGLTDYQKLAAEHFNDKFRALPTSVGFVVETHGYTLEQFVFLDFATNLAAFDAGITVWHFKLKYDAVRPFSAIRYLYGDRKITAWGGPGRGTVTDIRGSEWQSYLAVADHPEYPSASTALCTAHAQAARRFTGTDTLGQSVTIGPGESEVEPGVTPKAETVLGPWETWTEWEQECGVSRLWAGVHFRGSIAAGAPLGTLIGDQAYEFVAAHIDGHPPRRW